MFFDIPKPFLKGLDHNVEYRLAHPAKLSDHFTLVSDLILDLKQRLLDCIGLLYRFPFSVKYALHLKFELRFCI